MITALTMPNFDPQQYSGKWYRLASKPLIWERGCQSSIAQYSYSYQNGMFSLKNTCIKSDSSSYSRSGFVQILNENEPAKLQVTFNDGLPSDGPAPYWVHWTDYNNYSIVGGPSGNFLWILGRSPKASRSDLLKLSNYIVLLGYNIDDVEIAYGALLD